jgi:VWFA-related protein
MVMNVRSSLFALGLMVAGAVVCFGQGEPAPGLQRRGEGDLDTLKASARLVVLDVVVTDGKGHPVTGLKAGDFTLLEDGAAQKVSSFTEHGPIDAAVAAKMVAAEKLPPNVFTNMRPAGNGSSSTVILMDALDTSLQAQMVLRQQVIEYMKTVQPGTQMAIFQLDMNMHMIQGMTADPDALRAAVNGKRDQIAMTPLLGGPYAPEFEKQREKRMILTRSMQALAQYLSAFPGRKNLIWFTGDIPFDFYGANPRNPFVDEQDSFEQFGKMTDALRLNRVAIYPIDARGLRTDPRFSAERSGMPALNSSFGMRDAAQHGYLDDVAEKTGGRAFYNSNGLKEAIAEVVDTGSHFYTLAYAPTNKTMDNGYRALKVTMAAQGLHLEYRRGYFAAPDRSSRGQRMRLAKPVVGAEGKILGGESADELKSRTTLENAMKMGAAPAQQILFYARVTPQPEVIKDKQAPQGNYLDEKMRGKGYRNYAIHYSIDTRPMQFRQDADGVYHNRLEYVAELYDNQGTRLNGVISGANVDVDDASYQRMMKSGMGVDQEIALPAKGMFFLRLGVHDVNGNLMGTLEIPTESIAVP